MKSLLAVSLCAVCLVPAARGQLFSDTFNSRTTLPPWVAQSGTWTVGGNVMKGGTNGTLTYGYAYITNNYTDFSVQAQVQFPVGAFGGGLGGRLNTNSGAHYAAWVYPENSTGGSNTLKLLRFDSYSSFVVLQQANLTAVGTSLHTVKLELSGNLINVHFDGSKLMTATDATYSSGSVSLGMWTGDAGYQMTVDNVVVNGMPLVANNDNYAAVSGTPLVVAAPGVLANDGGGNGALSAVLAASTDHGTLALNSNGSFTYTATNDFTGTDTFTYRATDGQSNSAPATVTISVVSILYSDEFNRTSLSPWVAQLGNWAVANGVLKGGTNTSLSYGLTCLTNQWSYYSVQASVQLPAGAFGAGIDACLDTATGTRYAAWIYPEGSEGGANTLKLIKFLNWSDFTMLQQATLTGVGTAAHTLKLACAGNQLKVYFDGALLINAADSVSPYPGGGIGVDFWTAATGYQISVDNVLVTSIPVNDKLYEDFDNVTPPALPADWTTSATTGQSLWFTTNSPRDTAPNAVYCSDAVTNNDSILVSPTLFVAASPPQLTFRSSFDLESGTTEGYDGGVLEIRIGTGDFVDITNAGGVFVRGGYNRTISTRYGNPLAGRQAWSGATAGFQNVAVNLPEAAVGNTVQLRWRLGTDNANRRRGWNIDTVAVKVNTAPKLPVQTDQTILELATLSVTNTATDTDLPADTLTYSLLAAPTNATIAAGGVITWVPTEAQGPSTNTFTTRVVDNGASPLSATNTFTVVVNESNRPPVLPAQANRTIAPNVTLSVTNTASDPDIPANSLAYSLTTPPGFATINPGTGVITLSPTLANVGNVYIVTTIVTDSNPSAVNSQHLSATNSFSVLVSSDPVLSLSSTTLILEGCPPGNAVIDPGETVTLLFTLQNSGAANTTNLVATLLTANGVTAPSEPQTYGVLVAGGGAVSLPFSFTATGTCGGTITPTLQLQDGTADLGAVSAPFTLGQFRNLVITTQNFDSVTAPALPADWTTSSSGDQSDWRTTTSGFDTAPNSAFTADGPSTGISDLLSPLISLSNAVATLHLTFRHNYSLESSSTTTSTGYDGGVLEIKIGDNDFLDITNAGGVFLSGGYNSRISSSYGSPIAGRGAWSGTNSLFTNTTVRLPASALGQTIQLRWRCATDGGGDSGAGWRIDSIGMTEDGPGCCVNTAPILPSQTDRTLLELTTLSVTNTATDLESPPETLAYSLVITPTNAPTNPVTNAVISGNGIITWIPTELQGPGTYSVTTVVRDSANPPLSDTNAFLVTVNEENLAPVLAVPASQTINKLVPWTANATASDADLPPNTLTFELVSGPDGLTASPAGSISWTPADEQGPSTNTVALRVFDNGAPSLSATNSFILVVNSATNALPPEIQSIRLSNGIVTISWSAVAGRTYRLQAAQYCPAGTNWDDVPPDVPATGPVASATNAVGGVQQKYYRVYLLP